MENFQVNVLGKYQRHELVKILEEYASSLNMQNGYLINTVIGSIKKPELVIVVKRNDEWIGFACLEHSKWDSSHFGFNIGKVKSIAFRNLEGNLKWKIRAMLIDEIIDYARKLHFKCFICRINAADMDTIHVLQSRDFLLMDILMTFVFEFGDKQQMINKSPNNGIIIRPCEVTDISTLKQIAKFSFSATHFHMDPRFPKEKVNDLYARWISNCFKNRADTIIVAQHNQKVVGFVACKINKRDNYGIIDLIAVSPDFRGIGVGNRLITASLNWFAKRANKVYASTQAQNIPAIELYQRKGFKLLRCEMTFHKWFK